MATDEIIVKDFPSLIDALAAIRERLGISFELLDEIAGLSRGHSCKILSEQSKGMGKLSFNLLVGALGLEIAIRPDLAAREKLAHRYSPRRENQVRENQPVSKRLLDRCRPVILAELGHAGGIASARARRRERRNGANGHATAK